MADTVAELLVAIKADTSDLQSKFGDAQNQVKSFGSSLSSIGTAAGAALTVGVTAPLMAIGAYALKASSDVGGAYTAIKKETAATGVELEGLKKTFNTVFNSVPVDAKAAGDAIGYLHEKTGATGDALTSLSTIVVNLSRVTGSDLTTQVRAVGDAMATWKVKVSDQEAALNTLYKVSIEAAMPFDKLLTVLQQYAPVFQAMNMSMTDAALTIGSLTKAGMDVEPVLNGLRTWMGKVATETTKANDAMAGGKTSVAEYNEVLNKVPHNFEDIYNQIKNATNYQDAYNLSVTYFGSRAAPTMTKAIRDNVLNLTEFKKLVAGSSADINKMATDTTTLSEAFKLFNQKMELAFAPLGATIGKSLKDALASMTPFTDMLQRLGGAFDVLPGPVKQFIVLIGAVAASLGPTILGITTFAGGLAQLATFMGLSVSLTGIATAIGAIALVALPVITVIAGLAAGLAVAWQTSETFRTVVTKLGEAFNVFSGHISKALGLIMSGNWQAGMAEIGKAFSDLPKWLEIIDWDATGRQIITEIKAGIANHKSEILNAFDNIANDIATFIEKQPWDSIGQRIGKTLGGVISVALRAATTGLTGMDLLGDGGGATGGNATIASAQGTSIETSAIVANKGQGASRLETAGTTAAASFTKGFIQGLKDGMANVDWGSILMGAATFDWSDPFGEGKKKRKGKKTDEGSPARAVEDFLGDSDWPFGAENTKGGILDPNGEPWASLKNITLPNPFEGWTLPAMPDFGAMISGIKLPALPAFDVGHAFDGFATINLPGKIAGLFAGIKLPALPALPDFKLPAMPDFGSLFAGIKLPALPALPDFKLPAMPDIAGSISSLFAGITMPTLTIPPISLPDINPLQTLKSIWDGFTGAIKNIGFNISIPDLNPLNTLKGILDWITSHFSVHEVGFALNMPNTNPLEGFQSSLKWIVDNFSVHEIGFNLSVLGMDKLNGAIDKWNNLSASIKAGPWDVGGQHIPGFNTPSPHIPGFNTPTPHIPGFSTGNIGVPGFSTGNVAVPGIPGFTLGPYSIGVPGFDIPGIDFGPLGKWNGFSWGGTSLTTGSAGWNGWGGATIPSVGWSGTNIPPVGWSGYTVPSVGWGGYTVPSVGWGGYTVPSVGWGGYTVPSVGWAGTNVPKITVPGINETWNSPDIPKFETGGYVPKDTLAMLHSGEYVIPSSQASGSGGSWYDPGVGAMRLPTVEAELSYMKSIEAANGASLAQIASIEAQIRDAYAQHYAEAQKTAVATQATAAVAEASAKQNTVDMGAGAWYDQGVGDWRRASVEAEVAAMKQLSGPGANTAQVEANIRAAYKAHYGYATGGIARSPQIARLAEKGPEIILSPNSLKGLLSGGSRSEGSSGNHIHYHINLTGLITEPITEEEIVKLIKRAEAMQGAQYG